MIEYRGEDIIWGFLDLLGKRERRAAVDCGSVTALDNHLWGEGTRLVFSGRRRAPRILWVELNAYIWKRLLCSYLKKNFIVKLAIKWSFKSDPKTKIKIIKKKNLFTV